MKLIIVILLLIFLIILSIVISYAMIVEANKIVDIVEKRNSEKSNMDMRILLSKVDVLKSRELMDTLIKSKLMEWQIYNPNPTTENYIGKKEMDDAIKYIIKKLCMEMTPALKLQLSFGYPMEDIDSIIESIKNRAMLIVLDYSVEQNKTSTDNRMMKVFEDN